MISVTTNGRLRTMASWPTSGVITVAFKIYALRYVQILNPTDLTYGEAVAPGDALALMYFPRTLDLIGAHDSLPSPDAPSPTVLSPTRISRITD